MFPLLQQTVVTYLISVREWIEKLYNFPPKGNNFVFKKKRTLNKHIETLNIRPGEAHMIFIIFYFAISFNFYFLNIDPLLSESSQLSTMCLIIIFLEDANSTHHSTFNDIIYELCCIYFFFWDCEEGEPTLQKFRSLQWDSLSCVEISFLLLLLFQCWIFTQVPNGSPMSETQTSHANKTTKMRCNCWRGLNAILPENSSLVSLFIARARIASTRLVGRRDIFTIEKTMLKT